MRYFFAPNCSRKTLGCCSISIFFVDISFLGSSSPPGTTVLSPENNLPMMSLEELENTLEGCKNNSRLSQKRLYDEFYGFGMSVCERYSQSREEAEEIFHDSFVKAFSKMGSFVGVGGFPSWLKRIFINTAIDYFRKYHKSQPRMEDIDAPAARSLAASDPSVLEKFSIDEKLRMVAELPPSCRMAFNLYAVEGFETAEIAKMLIITEGTVRANLAKARFKLQKMIESTDKIKITAK